mmetsp:Transcript_59/g.63  ORF Transcript_59/g.63 Transcript_59/m.63 type:complete len:395 (+) Transcript_59:36-1220(+)
MNIPNRWIRLRSIRPHSNSNNSVRARDGIEDLKDNVRRLRPNVKIIPVALFFTTIVCGLVRLTTMVSSRAMIPRNNNPKCALLFFGLVKEFEHHVYPSIVKNILYPNPHCDVFLHTYNITSTPVNKRNLETNQSPLNVSEALLLTSRDRIAFETEESFNAKRMDVMERTRKNYHRGWGGCCLSHDNMIKQWNSIQGVWDLMRKHEIQQLMPAASQPLKAKARGTKNDPSIEDAHYYDQIGLFRSDVLYTNPINIFDAKAAAPNFARNGGHNDRLFYGNYEFAKIWASQRFDFIDTFEQTYMKRYDVDFKSEKERILFKDGYHSETFVKLLLDHYKVPVTLKDICVWRIRSGSRVQVSDCRDMKEFNTLSGIDKYLPEREKKGGRLPAVFVQLAK